MRTVIKARMAGPAASFATGLAFVAAGWLALAGLLPWGMAGCGRAGGIPDVRTTLFATYPPNTALVLVSGDLRSAAVVTEGRGRLSVMFGGRTGPECTEIRHLGISHDGTHLAYCNVRPDGRASSVIDGIRSQWYDGIRSWSFSPRSGHVAFVGERGAAGVLELDGRIVATRGSVLCAEVSPSGARVAYAERRAEGEFVVVDGEDHGPYTEFGLGTLCFSPDGAHVAYTMRRGSEWFVVEDAEEHGPYRHAFPPTWSPNSRRLAYTVGVGGRQRVVVDGVAGIGCDATGLLVFSPDSARVAYPCRRGRQWAMIVDGVEGPRCDYSSFPVWSPNGRRLAFTRAHTEEPASLIDAVLQENPVTVVDDTVTPGYGQWITFSDTDDHVAFKVRQRGRDSVLLDGVRVATAPWVRHILFSPDGSGFAFIAESAADGRREAGVHAPFIGYAYRSVVLAPRDGLDQWVVACGSPGRHYDAIGIESIHFRDDGTLVYVAAKDGSLLVVEDVSCADVSAPGR